MKLLPSRRAESVAQAEIRVMTVECEKAGGINLAQGVCDTEVPLVVRSAAHHAIEEGQNSYSHFDGIRQLRQAIARKMSAYNGMAVDPATEVTVSAGSTGSFFCVCFALLNPGDAVVLFEPYYGYHLNTLLAVDAIPTYVTLNAPDWTFSADDLERAITPHTRAIVVNTPANPSGKVFSRAELECIADCAERHDLFILTDEIYEYFVYDGGRHVSPATLPGSRGRTITISGYSKTFSITGWRIGYSIADERWTRIIGYVNDLVYVCAPSPFQYGVARGIDELGAKFYRDLATEYAAKRDKTCYALQDAGLWPSIPQGAYYVLADVSRLPGRTSKEKAMYLLEKTGVASVPGDAFFHGSGGENLVRFCFAKKTAELDEACNRLARLKSLFQANFSARSSLSRSNP